jgi:Phosphoribosyl transferase domain
MWSRGRPDLRGVREGPAATAAARAAAPARRLGRGVRLRRSGAGDRGAGEVPQRAGRDPVAGGRDGRRARRALPGVGQASLEQGSGRSGLRLPRRAGPSGHATIDTVLTWAPASSERRRRTGFDHGELLGRAVARQLELPATSLITREHGPPQTGRSRAARRPGPALGTIRTRSAVVAGRTVLLVDDVATTGATLAAAAAALRRPPPGRSRAGGRADRRCHARAGPPRPVRLTRRRVDRPGRRALRPAYTSKMTGAGAVAWPRCS